MEWGKRSYQEMSGGVDDEEHDAKRSSAIGEHEAKRSSAIGGGYDDDDDDVYHLAYRYSIRNHYPSPERDYLHVKALEQLPVYDVKTLDLHIKHFDKEPAIFEGLTKRVTSGIDDQKTWFSELRKVWKGTESPEEAGRLILDILYELGGAHGCHLGDIMGFLEHYGLPSLFKLEPSCLESPWFFAPTICGSYFIKKLALLNS